MIYYDHGLGKAFTNYSFYYDGNEDDDALVYLALANQLIHELYPESAHHCRRNERIAPALPRLLLKKA